MMNILGIDSSGLVATAFKVVLKNASMSPSAIYILARIQLISFIKSLLLPSLERTFSNIFLKAIKSESSPDIRSTLHSMVTT